MLETLAPLVALSERGTFLVNAVRLFTAELTSDDVHAKQASSSMARAPHIPL